MSEYMCNVTEPGKPSAPGNLSLERRAAMLLGGESVPSAVIQALLNNQTMKPIINGHSDVVVLHHFTPLDGGLELSVLRRNLAGPMQFRCISMGLDAESAKLAENKLARCVLLDWKDGSHKLLPPQAITFVAELPAHDQQRFASPPLPADFSVMSISSEGKPEISVTWRKKWSEDPVYGPAWVEELKKSDEILTSPAAGMVVPAGAEGGGSDSQGEVPGVSYGDEWQPRDKDLAGVSHQCQSEIANVTLLITQEAAVYLTVDGPGPVRISSDKTIFKMPAADWFKPPKSTRLLANEGEKWLHVFELNSDEAAVTQRLFRNIFSFFVI